MCEHSPGAVFAVITNNQTKTVWLQKKVKPSKQNHALKCYLIVIKKRNADQNGDMVLAH